MAGEIACDFRVGVSVYAQIRNRTSGYIWNGSSFEVYSSNSGNLATYAIPMTEQGVGSAHYVANAPATLPPGVFDVTAKQKLTTPYLESDPNVAGGELQWNGAIVVPESDLATSGQLGQFVPLKIYRGQMVRNFPVYLVSAVDGKTPFVSGVVSGQIARDGGGFGPLQSGAFTEQGLGFYNLQALTSGDLLANTAGLLFTANGISGGSSLPRPMSMILQKSSGQT